MTDPSVPIYSLTILFSVLLVLGLALCLPLFRFNVRSFVRSDLFIKVLFWIPIFLIFLVAMYASRLGRFILCLGLILQALRELSMVVRKNQRPQLYFIYFLVFSVSLLHFFALGNAEVPPVGLLIAICFGSVMSDVMAFFFGKYLGRHALPTAFNNHKSWEGVIGQIVGALLGVLLVNAFVLPVFTICLFLPIGVGSALGDLANSYVKRRAGIKDWSQSIPGHGGYIDRLSSLAGAIVLTYYFVLLS